MAQNYSFLKAGWVTEHEKQKHRPQWLTLTHEFLYFSDSDGREARLKRCVKLTQVKNLVPGRGNQFLLLLEKSKIGLSVDRVEECKDWIREIKAAIGVAQGGNGRETHFLNLERCFRELIQVLPTREEELQQVCSALHSKAENRLLAELAYLTNIETDLEQLLANFPTNPFSPTVQHYFRAKEKYLPISSPKDDVLDIASVKFCINSKTEVQNVLTSGLFFTPFDSLEYQVRRSQTTRALKWQYNGQRLDALTFRVNREVYVTGVGICTPYKKDGVTVVEEMRVLNGITTRGQVVYDHESVNELSFNSAASVTKLQFRVPVLIRVHQFHTLLLRISGSSTFKCVDCAETLEVGDNTHWTFRTTLFNSDHESNKSNDLCGPIADLYYRIPS